MFRHIELWFGLLTRCLQSHRSLLLENLAPATAGRAEAQASPTPDGSVISACAAITLFFGSVHLAYTFFTDQLTPVDRQLETAMKHVAVRISSETTMWKTWV